MNSTSAKTPATAPGAATPGTEPRRSWREITQTLTTHSDWLVFVTVALLVIAAFTVIPRANRAELANARPPDRPAQATAVAQKAPAATNAPSPSSLPAESEAKH